MRAGGEECINQHIPRYRPSDHGGKPLRKNERVVDKSPSPKPPKGGKVAKTEDETDTDPVKLVNDASIVDNETGEEVHGEPDSIHGKEVLADGQDHPNLTEGEDDPANWESMYGASNQPQSEEDPPEREAE